jgi:hypothetical protein
MSSPLLPYALACQATYDPTAIPQWQDEMKLVHVYLSIVNGIHTVAWEGTHDFQEWIVDFFALEIPVFNHLQMGPVHAGFMRDVFAVYQPIAAYFESLGWPPYDNTGHSKGCEAILFHGVMKQLGHPPRKTVAFESPRMGTSILRDYLADQDITQTATHNYHGTDLVTRVPFGPTWVDVREPIELIVPDADDIPTKHEIPAVVAALS